MHILQIRSEMKNIQLTVFHTTKSIICIMVYTQLYK